MQEVSINANSIKMNLSLVLIVSPFMQKYVKNILIIRRITYLTRINVTNNAYIFNEFIQDLRYKVTRYFFFLRGCLYEIK